jgi:hypothetical protein
MKNKLRINPKLLLMAFTSGKTMLAFLLLVPIKTETENTRKLTGNSRFLREIKELDSNEKQACK